MKAPRLLTRALVTSIVTVAIVLGAVFAVFSPRVRDQVRQAVPANLVSAQRSGRLPVEAVAELRRCSGTDFDASAVEALIAALPRVGIGG